LRTYRSHWMVCIIDPHMGTRCSTYNLIRA